MEALYVSFLLSLVGLCGSPRYATDVEVQELHQTVSMFLSKVLQSGLLQRLLLFSWIIGGDLSNLISSSVVVYLTSTASILGRIKDHRLGSEVRLPIIMSRHHRKILMIKHLPYRQS